MNPDAREKTVLQCLESHYGLSGRLDRLSGENLNYLLTTAEGSRLVVKIVGDDMSPDVVEMEFAAIEYAISSKIGLALPKILRNKFGNIETGIDLHINDLKRLRILTFVTGKTLQNCTDISINLLKNIGSSLANYHFAMQGFDHPSAHRNHRWNLAAAGQHKGKIGLLNDPEKRDLMEWGFNSWSRAKAALALLDQQFIHGDMNPENILVEGGQVTGLVDFGDACFNPAICDLAICAAYLMMDRPDPLPVMDTLLAGYQEVRPLNETETGILLPLVHGRLVTSIAISTERRGIDPGNPNWFGSEAGAWALLERLRNVSEL